MDSFELSIERLHARQMQFLGNASPDDWHRYANDHNWDERLDGLFWIVSQPDCDRATAILTFWKGCPTGYDYETEDAPMGDDVYAVAPLLRYISERFNTTGYPRAEISYDFRRDHGLNMEEYASADKEDRLRDIEELIDRQKDIENPKVKLHPDMKLLSIAGRKVGGYGDNREFYDLFPDDLDDDGAESGDAVATSRLSPQDSAEDAPQNGLTSDASVEASARIRAIRHQANANVYVASNAKNADQSTDTSRNPVMPRTMAGMKDAWGEAVGLFAGMFGFGAAIAFSAKFAFLNTASPLFWVAAIAAIAYCLHFALSNLRTLLLAAKEQDLQLSSSWITITTTIAVLVGIAIGRGCATRLLEPAVTPLTRFGLAAVAVVALVATTFALARILIRPKAFR
jgi:Domain of unknown function (DUF4274)